MGHLYTRQYSDNEFLWDTRRMSQHWRLGEDNHARLTGLIVTGHFVPDSSIFMVFNHSASLDDENNVLHGPDTSNTGVTDSMEGPHYDVLQLEHELDDSDNGIVEIRLPNMDIWTGIYIYTSHSMVITFLYDKVAGGMDWKYSNSWAQAKQVKDHVTAGQPFYQPWSQPGQPGYQPGTGGIIDKQ